ncbi:MAG: beta-hydroxyacyl-ACP dehydratase [Planctomycetota bacterium]|jgi:3-hydroxyacyl-[acyl-carrier-protein] dehydratase|nr:beta-hydroxyacyl-ACP dehydratase [Planctomycetota bacterium]
MNGLIDRLPHRPPFRFVTELRCVDPSAFEAVWSVSGDEDFFRGHFPGEPIVPGVLITEALAQTAGLHLLSREGGGSHGGMLVQSEVRFRKPVHPPAMISLRVTDDGSLGSLHRFEVRAFVRETLVADGTIVLAVIARDSDAPEQ